MESNEKIRSTDLYQAFRSEGYPIRYSDNKISASFDLELFALIFAFVAIGLSFVLILPGFRAGKQRLFVGIRCLSSILIGFFIFYCNFEYNWESDSIKTSVRYKSSSGQHINASIGLKIGLRGINITLIGLPEQQIGEIIKYNEHFSWEWSQGRDGFGAKSGTFHKEYREAQYRGLPHPILWIAEYFTFDGEGIRFGRHYRLAGWYCHIILWLSVGLYLLSNILFQMVIQYGALFLIMTGSSLITANILFSSIRNPIPLRIPFEGLANTPVVLSPSLSLCYYFNLINEIKVNKDVEKKQTINQRLSQMYGLRKRNLSDRLSRIQKSSVRKKPMTQPRSTTNNSEDIEPTEDTPLYENFQRFEPIGEEPEENQL